MPSLTASDPAPRPAAFFAIRTALLPWRDFEEIVSDSRYLPLEERRGCVRARLRDLVQRPDIREALLIASPDLDAAIPIWFEDAESEKGRRAERAIVRYVARMCGRATPFGLFAGCSIGTVGESTCVQLNSHQSYLRHTRLDMDYLTALTGKFGEDHAFRSKLRYRPNSSLYRAGGRLRYAEARLRGKDRAYHLVAVDETSYLLGLLQRAQNGSTLEDLAITLVDEEISLEEAQAFVQELADSQILMPELQPAVTGPEPIHDVIRQLGDLPEGESPAAVLSSVQQALENLDARPFGSQAACYTGLAESLKHLPAEVELNRLFQVDMVKPVIVATLGKPVIAEILLGIQLLQRLFAGYQKGALQRFIEAFRDRYEDEERPLVEVLDEECGIGFDASRAPGAEASPLLEGIAFPGAGHDSSSNWMGLHAFLLNKLLQDPKARILKLSEKDLERFYLAPTLPLPGAFSVTARLSAVNDEALNRGEFQLYLSGLSGPSGANLLGRFCHGDPLLTREVRVHLAEEQALFPDALLAEIVHLPEGRIGNVILRPALRDYEIPFLGRSGVPDDHQIPVTDLLVSVQGGRIVLRSKRLGKEILPRLTNAHNFSLRSLGVYRFLCMHQHQGHCGGLSWTWGALESASFLPRIEVGRLVLAKARWRVEGETAKTLAQAKEDERWENVQAWRDTTGLPRLVVLVDGDNKLPIDLDNPLSIESFLDVIKKRREFVVEEFFPDPTNLFAAGPEGTFVHELVVPFIAQGTNTQVAQSRGETPGDRSFLPGSPWLYAKFYTGTSGVDQLLREDLRPVLESMREQGVIDTWFFIRYSDPDWHLRLRVHGDPARLAAVAIPTLGLLGEELRRKGRIWKLQFDTYQRELERYGGLEAVPLCEAFFEADSEAVLSILAAYPGDLAADARWRLTLKGMDLLLEDLGFNFEGRLKILEGVRGVFLREFHGEGLFERQLGDRFRKERKSLDSLMDGQLIPDSIRPGLDILAHRSKAMVPIREGLHSLAAEGRLVTSLEDLAGSFLHMHANRMLRSAARAQELVIYDFLTRLYQSRLARLRSTKTVPSDSQAK